MLDDPRKFEPDTPGPGVPTAPSPESVDPELQRAFWLLVLVFNVALLAFSLGLMLAFLSPYVRAGVVSTTVGVAAFVFGIAYYRRFEATR